MSNSEPSVGNEADQPSWTPGFYDDGSGKKRWWDGSTWTDQYESTVSTPKIKKPGKRVPLWALVVTGSGALVLGLIIGIPSGAVSSRGVGHGTAAAAGPAPTVTVPGPVQTVTVTPAPPPPTNSFKGNGIYMVGTNPPPGTYSTAGPDGSNPVGCYYAFKTGTDSGAQIKDNNILKGAGIVTLNPGDIFESRSCQDWVKQ